MKYGLWLVVLALLLGLAACGGGDKIETAAKPFDILAEAEPVPTLMTQALAVHAALQAPDEESGTSGTLGSPIDPGDLHMYTLTTEDFYGNPFTNINFVAPTKIGDNIWNFADTLKGKT